MDVEVKHRRLRWIGHDLDPVERGQRRAQLAGVGDELRDAGQNLVKAALGRDQVGMDAVEAPAVRTCQIRASSMKSAGPARAAPAGAARSL